MAATVKRYTEESLQRMDEKANKRVLAMTGAGVGVGFAPVMVDVADGGNGRRRCIDWRLL